MKTTPKAFIALALLVPAAACADADSANNETESGGETASQEVGSDDFHVYSVGGLRLDCPQGFEKLQANAIATDGMELVTETDEQIAYMSGQVSYTLTKEAHFAYPMIIRRDVVVDEMDKLSISMAACGYGTKEASEKTMEGFAMLNERFLLQNKIQLRSGSASNLEISDQDRTPEAEDQE